MLDTPMSEQIVFFLIEKHCGLLELELWDDHDDIIRYSTCLCTLYILFW